MPILGYPVLNTRSYKGELSIIKGITIQSVRARNPYHYNVLHLQSPQRLAPAYWPSTASAFYDIILSVPSIAVFWVKRSALQSVGCEFVAKLRESLPQYFILVWVYFGKALLNFQYRKTLQLVESERIFVICYLEPNEPRLWG